MQQQKACENKTMPLSCCSELLDQLWNLGDGTSHVVVIHLMRGHLSMAADPCLGIFLRVHRVYAFYEVMIIL
jgi:hypothetical protein